MLWRLFASLGFPIEEHGVGEDEQLWEEAEGKEPDPRFLFLALGLAGERVATGRWKGEFARDFIVREI